MIWMWKFSEELAVLDFKGNEITNFINNPLQYMFGIEKSCKKLIVVNENGEDVTYSFNKESFLVKYYLLKRKICRYKCLTELDYEKRIDERNDVHIYKTILYPPKSKPPKTN